MTLTNTKNLPEQSTFNETWVLIKGWRRFKLTLERKMLSPSDNFETTKNVQNPNHILSQSQIYNYNYRCKFIIIISAPFTTIMIIPTCLGKNICCFWCHCSENQGATTFAHCAHIHKLRAT